MVIYYSYWMPTNYILVNRKTGYPIYKILEFRGHLSSKRNPVRQTTSLPSYKSGKICKSIGYNVENLIESYIL